MTPARKSRLMGYAGLLVGGGGLAYALYGGNRWTVALSGFVYGATVMVVLWSRWLTRGKA